MSTESQPNIANLMGMARTAELAGNSIEAANYYNRVLELEPRYSEAWIGKGKAAAWQSTLAHLRFNEMRVAFNHAIATATDDQVSAVRNEVTEQANIIVASIYNLARNHMLQFVSLDATWPSYLGQVAEMLDALQEAATWDPTNRNTFENIIHLAKDNIEGIAFRDPIQNMPGSHGITPQYEALLRSRMNEAVESLRVLDPSYAPPAIEKKQADACFVVTATMGDHDHPTVRLMRQFRDERLTESVIGRAMIKVYYQVGPGIAALIRHSPLLRRMSYRLVVAPAARFARSRLRLSEKQD